MGEPKLPPGMTLDEPAKLPPGMTLDSAEAPLKAPSVPSLGERMETSLQGPGILRGVGRAALGTLKFIGQAGSNPMQAAQDVVQAHLDEAEKAKQYYAQSKTYQPITANPLSHIKAVGRAIYGADEAEHMGNVHAMGAAVPLVGPLAANLEERAHSGDVTGALAEGATYAATGAGVNKLARGRTPKVNNSPATNFTPKQAEALTSVLDKTNLAPGDIHSEISEPALPLLRDQAARMGIDPKTAFQGRATVKLPDGTPTHLAVKIADDAYKGVNAEVAQISKPYQAQVVSQKPIADAYRSFVTDDIRANEPQLANRLEAEAAKFDKDSTLQQVNQTRVRFNNELFAFENKPTAKQVASDVEMRAMKAAANAARQVQYGALENLSGLPQEYIRGLMQKEGVLIEARNSLQARFNKASAAQSEAVSQTFREKVAGTRPSRTGVEHSIVREFLGMKPLDVFNNRLQTAFGDLGQPSVKAGPPINQPASPSGSPPPVPGRGQSMGARGPFYQPASSLDSPVTPQPPYSSATDVMLAAKEGRITPGEASRLTQKMKGKGGTQVRRITPVFPPSRERR